MDLLQKATKIAYHAHKHQKRKYFDIPFISHPLEVCKKLCVWGIKSQEILATGILHDSIEDNLDRQAEIGRDIAELGGQIYSWVTDLTIYDGVKKDDYIKTFDRKPVEVLIVKLADRVCNLSDFYTENPRGYFHKYYQKSKILFAIYEIRKNEVCMQSGRNVLLNIDRSLLDLENLATKE